jgi:hypothetical protein
MRWMIGTFVLSLTWSLSCSRDSNSGPPTKNVVAVASTEFSRRMITTDDAMSEPNLSRWTLETHLSIPNVFSDEPDRIPATGCLAFDKSGQLVTFVIPSETSAADGANAKGGFGCDGGIEADEGSERFSLVLRIGYSWTTADQVNGSLNQLVTVHAGRSQTFNLKGGARIKVAWRAVPPTTQPHS